MSQGVIGVCARADDADDPAVAAAARMTPRRAWPATAERALLRRIEGGCQVPLGALATRAGRRGCASMPRVCALDGARMLTASGEAPATAAEAAALGQRVAEELLARGAAALIAQERDRARGGGAVSETVVKPVVVTRAEGDRRPAEPRAEEPRAAVLLWPAVQLSRCDSERLGEALAHIGAFDWIVFASRHAVAAVLERLPPRLPACASPPSGRRPRRCCASAAGRSTWCRTKPTPRRWSPPSPPSGGRATAA